MGGRSDLFGDVKVTSAVFDPDHPDNKEDDKKKKKKNGKPGVKVVDGARPDAHDWMLTLGPDCGQSPSGLCARVLVFNSSFGSLSHK